MSALASRLAKLEDAFPEPVAPAPDFWPAPPGEAAFSGPLGRVVRAVEPRSEADPAALLAQLLAGFGNLVGRGAGFAVEGDFHAPNINVAIVGQTAKARKGTSWGRVREVLALVDPDWAARRILGGLSSGEGLVHQVRDPVITRRDAKESELDDADADGCITEVDDAGESDKRLLVVEGELAQALKVMTRPGNTLSSTVRLLWDRGDVGSLTRTSPVRTTGAHVSIVGHIVADELNRELTSIDAANGFANRFMFVCAHRSKLLPDGAPLDQGELRLLADELRRAADFAREFRGTMIRTPDARVLWHDVYPELSAGGDGAFGAVTARAEAQVLRLSVISALADQARAVDVEHLRAALAVWSYCEASAGYIFGQILGDPLADRFHAALRHAGESGLTRTEIRDLAGGHVLKPRIEDALRLLERRGLARSSDFPTGG